MVIWLKLFFHFEEKKHSWTSDIFLIDWGILTKTKKRSYTLWVGMIWLESWSRRSHRLAVDWRHLSSSHLPSSHLSSSHILYLRKIFWSTQTDFKWILIYWRLIFWHWLSEYLWAPWPPFFKGRGLRQVLGRCSFTLCLSIRALSQNLSK